ncbi:hypothetical protein R5R35_001245 [Gryllus longicercus]|uniref:Vacuolar protein sorting-associated protein 72 homolog n=1 Tax=Gryllus longicercus TaxID=2509291 RepID=A0AAN9Z0R1_9ORTH
MALAKTRDRRNNAGARMAKLLDEEEEDEFYKTTYGGFNEIENDDDYHSEEEAEDEVDSDFSIDENDEPVSDHEEEGPKRSKKLVTKAYKEPDPVKKIEKPSEAKPKKTRKRRVHIMLDNYERKSIRRSTAAKSAETLQRLKERSEEGRKRRRRKTTDMRKLTQEELLEEAKITEEENLKSLEKFQKMELEKKKTRLVKKTVLGHTICYHSLIMPLVEVLKPSHESPITVDEEPSSSSQETVTPTPEVKSEIGRFEEGKCERTFITFSDERSFKNLFSSRKKQSCLQKSICPISRLPARYFDPVTELPYANLQAFRILREAYYQQLEAKGDRTNPSVARWIEWRKTQREKKTAFLQQIGRAKDQQGATGGGTASVPAVTTPIPTSGVNPTVSGPVAAALTGSMSVHQGT